MIKQTSDRGRIGRHSMLGAAGALAASPAVAEDCRIGPVPHHKGPLVFMGYDQVELDASYDQIQYEPTIWRVSQRARMASLLLARRRSHKRAAVSKDGHKL
jgi:hypothetical protein